MQFFVKEATDFITADGRFVARYLPIFTYNVTDTNREFVEELVASGAASYGSQPPAHGLNVQAAPSQVKATLKVKE